MIKKFIKERLSWIALILSLQLLIIFVAFLDSAVPLTPILYIVFLMFLIFLFFLTFRYQKETKFYQSLVERDNDLDLSNIADADSPFEEIIQNSIIAQTEQLKQEAIKNSLILEQEKDDLMSWIHEAKTPMTALHLMIGRLKDEQIKAQMTYEWLRIHLLLDQQLHQKRILFIENDLYIEKVDIQSIIFSEIKTLQTWCIQKGIGFDIELEAKEVLSDAKWLAFIIRQLLTNAVKYSEASDIIVKSYQKEEQAILEVKDFGRGIDPRDLPRIFDKGFTSTANHHDHAATGIGLYLTKKAAEPLFIKVDVHSTLGVGTTFTLTFPKRNDFHRIIGM